MKTLMSSTDRVRSPSSDSETVILTQASRPLQTSLTGSCLLVPEPALTVNASLRTFVLRWPPLRLLYFMTRLFCLNHLKIAARGCHGACCLWSVRARARPPAACAHQLRVLCAAFRGCARTHLQLAQKFAVLMILLSSCRFVLTTH